MSSSKQLADVLEKDQVVCVRTLERYVSVFGTEPRRLSQPRWIYTLISVKQGKGHCLLDNDPVPLQPGTLLLVSPFTFLHLEDTVYVQGAVISFTEEFLCRTSLYEQLLYKTMYGPGKAAIFQLGEKETGNNYVQSQLSMFSWEYRLGKDPLLKFDFLHNILLGIILYMHKLQLEGAQIRMDHSEPLAKSQVIQFIQLLNRHFKEESSLQFYADEMNITQSQLAQVCKKGVGWSPKAMMQEKLLREAKRLLLFDLRSVKEVSYDLGFTEPTNFVKFFQQHTGISPKSFRIENCIAGLDEQAEAEV